MADVFNYNNTAVVKCTNCGADMTYDPERGALHCSYCDATRSIDKKISFKRDYLASVKDGEVKFDDSTYKCPNCGAEVKLSSFDTAIKCPYCGGTNVVEIDDMKGLKPDSILPFALSQQQASTAGKKWIKRNFLRRGISKKVSRLKISKAFTSRLTLFRQMLFPLMTEESAKDAQERWGAEKIAAWKRT